MTTQLLQLISQAEQEASRTLSICNACRYCEGFCAVFPAMTRRLSFDKADLHYLANLCHNCGACLHACQYAPPHEFAVNVPQAMAQVRGQTYADYAWPRALGAAYQRNGLVLSLSLSAGLALFLVLAVVLGGGLWRDGLQTNFYAVFPHNLLALLFGAVFGFAVLAFAVGVRRFWRQVQPPSGQTEAPAKPGVARATSPAVLEAVHNALTLKFLDGNANADEAAGCPNTDDQPTQWRRRFHHAVFYGFALCFAATSVATLYHYVWAWPAPYPYTSLPVMLGSLGGVLMLIGTVGLAYLQRQRYQSDQSDGSTLQAMQGAPAQKSMDMGFVALLFLTSLTGMVLLIGRETAGMPLLLAVHLGVVMALFATLPYSKMAHGVYRSAALLKWAIERRQPSALNLGKD
jgi:citrate/tricarballylate utilization protein